MDRCQECQTYGDDANRLIEIAVDDGEGIFECEDCLGADEVGYIEPFRLQAARAGEGE